MQHPSSTGHRSSTDAWTILLWFGLASFLCSALLFWVEPLVGKQLLPMLGGAPAVWNVCLLFFQAALLAGYAFAHAVTRLRSVRAQATAYAALAVASALVLPIQFDSPATDPAHPALWLLTQLSRGLLLPFIALAAAAPLLQHWFSRGDRAGSDDPYVLYAASNAGSLLALLSFPVLIEPHIRLHVQNHIWSVMFAVAAVLLYATSWSLRSSAPVAKQDDSAISANGAALSVRTVITWMILAAVPSSLLMGVTTYLTADIAPIPLLWVVPLAIYLLTFIAAFGMRRRELPAILQRIVVLVAITWCMLYRLQATDPLWLLVMVHLTVFAVLAFAAHARLAALRPGTNHLTAFYLAIAAGGAIGGVFNALVAPALFSSYAEYPIAVLAAVALVLMSHSAGAGTAAMRRFGPLVLLVIATVVGTTLLHLPIGPAHAIIAVGIPVALSYLLSGNAIAFVLALSIVIGGARFDTSLQGDEMHAERNFYGVIRITRDAEHRFHEMRHGNTLHGASDLMTPGRSEPLMYYWTGSAIADVIRNMQQQRDSLRVGVVGLGVGALAWYAEPDEQWTYYEINPAVIRAAENAQWFDFLSRTHANSMNIVAGDARMNLRKAARGSYDLLVLDAFTSDAIPLHLLTAEALHVYTATLHPHGVIAFHISNRYLDLAPAIAAVGNAAGYQAYIREVHVGDRERAQRIESSDWLVLVRSPADLPAILAANRWTVVDPHRSAVWTDDYSNIWAAFTH